MQMALIVCDVFANIRKINVLGVLISHLQDERS